MLMLLPIKMADFQLRLISCTCATLLHGPSWQVFMTRFITKVTPTKCMTSNYYTNGLKLVNQSQCLDITPLVIYGLGADTHTHKHTDVIYIPICVSFVTGSDQS